MHDLLNLDPVFVSFSSLLPLMQRTWLIILLAWFGFRQLIRSTGLLVSVGEDLFILGWFSVGIMALSVGSPEAGSAIVHFLALSFLVLGCAARFISILVSGSRNRRSWGN
jgi:hypothetical protein